MNPIFLFALREDLKEDKRFLPTKAHNTDTGYDVRAAMPDRQPLVIKPFEYVKIPLGFRAMVPENWWYELRPRSSTFSKKQLHALYGTIDETFENELVFAAQYIPESVVDHNGKLSIGYDMNLIINFGDAIGQIVPVERQTMGVVEISNQELDERYKIRNGSRKTGGFGSTGN